MLPSSKNTDVGIHWCQLVSEQIMQIKLFWTDNAKCTVEYDFNVNSCDYPVLIHFMCVSMVTT